MTRLKIGRFFTSWKRERERRAKSASTIRDYIVQQLPAQHCVIKRARAASCGKLIERERKREREPSLLLRQIAKIALLTCLGSRMYMYPDFARKIQKWNMRYNIFFFYTLSRIHVVKIKKFRAIRALHVYIICKLRYKRSKTISLCVCNVLKPIFSPIRGDFVRISHKSAIFLENQSKKKNVYAYRSLFVYWKN